MPKYYQIFPICILILASGCGRENSKRVYQEIVIESPLKTSWPGSEDPHASFRGSMPSQVPMSPGNIPDGLLDSVADVPLTWQKPDNWQEFPGSGFRLVTFKADEGDDAIECTIVSLSGAAGGIEANLSRWMGQINLEAPGEGLLEFLKNQGAYIAENSVRFFNFTKLQKDSPAQTPSLYVSILEFAGSTVFVKMTGSIQAVSKHKAEFLALSKSVSLKK